jgi:hypothetical protein
MIPNPGYCPHEATGKRIRARLANGQIGKSDDNVMSPPGWAADGKHGCRWSLSDHPFDIAEYEVL